MIFDKISNAGLYKGMHPNLDTAIDFMLTQDLEALPLGKTAIDGDRVFINKMEALAAPADEKLFEVHHKYMDIQIDVSGRETIQTGDSTVSLFAGAGVMLLAAGAFAVVVSKKKKMK